MKKIRWQLCSPDQRKALLKRPRTMSDSSILNQCQAIISLVREKGDSALAELTLKFDGVVVRNLEIATVGNIDPKSRSAIETAAKNIEKFHRAQLRENTQVKIDVGVVCEKIFKPLQSVGLYIPGGTAPLVSTVLMLAIPAAIAGCPVKVLCSPPNKKGEIDPAILFAAKFCGIEKVYTIGGAQAIAAMAYGTETIPKVDKIFGPGNAWVTMAKRCVSQDPEGAIIDMPAGPSEVMVIADSSADPGFVAADLLSQAEHGADSQVILVSDDESVLDQVLVEINSQSALLSRNTIIEKSLETSCAILVEKISDALEIANMFSPEHLIIQTERPRNVLSKITSAGSVFLGPWSPEAAGDYASGTNHVLPTYGYARSLSGLCVSDFQKSMSVQELTRSGLEKLSSSICTLADIEGLDAHKKAVEIRLSQRVMK